MPLTHNAYRTLCVALLCATFTGCGYFLYPERVGQVRGKLDPAVVILNGAALFVGVVPGVVAFAVDITTGTIYLPPNQKSILDKHENRRNKSSLFSQPAPNKIAFTPEIEQKIMEETGLTSLEHTLFYQTSTQLIHSN